VWRENAKEPTFYRMHTHGQLVNMRVLEGKPHLVLVIDGTYQLVGLPAT
jgi:hypothetical protein